jgi:hypothetical protein
MSKDMQSAINDLARNVQDQQIVNQLADTEIVLVLTGLLAMWAARANDERSDSDARDEYSRMSALDE